MSHQVIEVVNQYLPRPGSEERADEQAAVRDLAARLIEEAADLDAPAAAERLTNANFGTLEACRFFAAALVRKGCISDDLAARVEMTREVASRVAPVAATLLDVAEAYRRILDAAAAEAATAAAVAEVVEACAAQLVGEGLSPDLPTARRELRAEVASRAVVVTVADVVGAYTRMTASLRPLTPAALTPAGLLNALRHRGRACAAA